jgi:P27 family predicted phage terminase small subunit
MNPPKPTALKRLEGTWRPDRANPREPQPARLEVGARPPAWLRDKLARRYWRELVEILSPTGVLAVTDATALALLARTFAEWRRWVVWLEENEPTYETGSDDRALWRARPEMTFLREAERQLITLLREFGLTPAARTRIAAVGSAEADPAEEFLRGRRLG